MRPCVLAGMALAALALPGASATCDSLTSIQLPDTTVTLAQSVDAGAFVLPGGAGRGPAGAVFNTLPPFCRVAATLKPTTDFEIRIEVWLPAGNWNGKFQAVGNGGWAGTISYPAMAKALSQGYATASTDTENSTPGGSFVMGHPEEPIDYGYRAVHLMTV